MTCAAALATATAANAAAPRDDLLVTSGWLASHAGDKDLVILHVGSDAGYQALRQVGAAELIDELQSSTPPIAAISLSSRSVSSASALFSTLMAYPVCTRT